MYERIEWEEKREGLGGDFLWIEWRSAKCGNEKKKGKRLRAGSVPESKERPV